MEKFLKIKLRFNKLPKSDHYKKSLLTNDYLFRYSKENEAILLEKNFLFNEEKKKIQTDQ